MKKLMTLAAAALFCIGLSAQCPQKKCGNCEKKTEQCDQKKKCEKKGKECCKTGKKCKQACKKTVRLVPSNVRRKRPNNREGQFFESKSKLINICFSPANAVYLHQQSRTTLKNRLSGGFFRRLT